MPQQDAPFSISKERAITLLQEQRKEIQDGIRLFSATAGARLSQASATHLAEVTEALGMALGALQGASGTQEAPKLPLEHVQALERLHLILLNARLRKRKSVTIKPEEFEVFEKAIKAVLPSPF